MDALLVLEQTLNGVQFGVFLFLVSAGLTLVFGIMNFVNLAHGSLYMVGAYYAATIFDITGSFLMGLVIIVPACLITGVLLELAVVRPLYKRDHLDQVLVTFGLILFFNEAVRMIWGPAALFMPQPGGLTGHLEIIPDAPYPVYRLVIIGVGLLIALFLFLLITKTRIGMLIRAGASNRPMVGALGINITNLYTKVFGLGAVLAGIAGLMAAPVLSVQSGMGEEMLILAFVVIVIGGIGSIRGAFVASIIVGIVDTLGRTSIPVLLKVFVSQTASQTAGPALASMLIYVLMAAVLFFRPSGLFAARTG